jgi:hypothetical protein
MSRPSIIVMKLRDLVQSGLGGPPVTAEVAALQTAHKNALTCTVIAEGGCFGTHSALAVLDGFASSLGYSHTTRVFDVSQCLSASR